MEVLNHTSPSRPQFLPKFSFFSPKNSIKAWRKKNNPYRFNTPNSRLPLYPPFSTFLSVSTTRKLRVSAHFGGPTNRRNSLRKKLTEQNQQVRRNPIVYNPNSGSQNPVRDYDDSEPDYSNLDCDNVQERKFNPNYGVNEGTVRFDSPGESKSKRFGESVLWNNVENWVDQYKSESEFWGVGFGPIFTVFRDSEGNVKRAVVNEEEILKRSGIEPAIYKQSELDDLTEVNSKISHAEFLAREMESGNYVFSKNSSIVKFVVPEKQPGFAAAIQSLPVRTGLSLKLPKIGIMVLCFVFVFLAMRTVFPGGKEKAKHTSLEKEIMRRKVRARKEKEKLVKGSVEVILGSKEPLMLSAEKPRIDKQELMTSITKAKESITRLSPQESSSHQDTKSKDLDKQIQEIREMARRAREIERRDTSPVVGDGGNGTLNEVFDQKEVVKQRKQEVVSLPGELSGEYLDQTMGLNGTLVPKLFNDLESFETEFGKKESVHNGDTLPSGTPNMKFSDHGGSTTEDVAIKESSVNILDTPEVGQSSSTLKSQSGKIKKTFRTNIKVICSVKEAREFLSRKRDKQQPNQELHVSTLPEGAAISSLETEKETGCNAGQILEKDCEVSGMTISNGESDFTHVVDTCNRSVLKRKEFVSTKKSDHEAPREGSGATSLQIPGALGQVANISCKAAGPSVVALPKQIETDNTSQGSGESIKFLQPTILGGPSDFTSASSSGDTKIFKDGDSKYVEDGYAVDDLQKPQTLLAQESNSRSTEAMPSVSKDTMPSVSKENWMEKNFHQLEPVVSKIGGGFTDSYMVAREKAKQELDINCDRILPKFVEDDGELDWMKDDGLREIVFQVRENELAGKDPFDLMDEEDKLAFFEGLEKKVEKVNEKLSNLHEWLHSNIENLDYGSDGISLYDPPEKIIPRWKGPPVDKNPEFLNNFVEQRKTLIAKSCNSYNERKDGQSSLQMSPPNETSAVNNQNTNVVNGASKSAKTVIEGSDGSVKAGKKSGKEFWQHTKKWSRDFLHAYNAESDPEIKATMKEIGKDLDRWITEEEIQDTTDLMDKVPKRGRQFIQKQMSKVKREMELFGPQAVMSKYREYAEEKEEDYLWWLDLPFVLCIELYTNESGEQKIGLYSLEMAEDLELDPKQYHVIAFEDPGDCKNLCYIIQAHMEMLGNGKAFVVARPPKDAFREAKANGFSVTVIRKGELQLNVDQTLEEVEEQITEFGSKIYHDEIARESSMDINALTKGVFGASNPTERRRLRQKLKKPIK